MKLSTQQQEIARKQVNINSENQKYYDTDNDTVFDDFDASVYFNVNESIDNEQLIPFVPSFDL